MIQTEKTFQDIVETIEKAIISGDVVAAETCLSKPDYLAILKSDPLRKDIFLTQIAWNKGEFEVTRRKVASLLKHSSVKPGSTVWVELMMMRAFINHSLGHTLKAEKDLDKLLKTLPPDSEFYSEIQYNLASSNRDQGNLLEAGRLYDALIESNRSSPEIVTRSSLSMAKMKSDLDQHGVSHYTRIVSELAPLWGGWAALKTAEILDELASFREGRCGQSLKELHRHVREADESNFTVPRIRSRLALSEALIELGDYKTAKLLIEETGNILTNVQNSSLKHLQNYVELLWFQADVRQTGAQDHLWEALDRLEILLAVVAKYPRPPGPAPFWLLIGEIQCRLGLMEQGLRSIERARSEADSIGAVSVAASACYNLASFEWGLLDEKQRHQGIERNRILADTSQALETTSRSRRPELEWRIHYLRGKIFSESGEQYPSREEMKTAAAIVHNLIKSLDNPSVQSIYRQSPIRHDALLTLQTIHEPLQSVNQIQDQLKEPILSDGGRELDDASTFRQVQDVMNAMLELHSASDFNGLLEKLMVHMLQILNADRAETLLYPFGSTDIRSMIKIRSGRDDELTTLGIPEKWLREAVSTQGVLTYRWDADERNPESRYVAILAIRDREAVRGILCIDRFKAKGTFSTDEQAILKTLTTVASIAWSSLSIRKRLSEISDQFRREIVPDFPHIIGQSEPMKRVFVQMQRVASSDIPVLIQGETGTGKDLIARAIHDIGNRSSAAFVHLDCSAIPMTLLESELFGIEDGIATGVESRIGLMEYADGGTILMDEVGDIPLNTQAKLLRVLQEHEFEPIGSDRVISVDIRIIATTSKDIGELISTGKLREDFYYRISGLIINLPPLRERHGDIVILARTFLQRYNLEFRKNISGFSTDLLDAMISYPWPGNIRELDHLLRKAVLFCHGDRLTISDMDLPSIEPRRLSLKDAIRIMEIDTVRKVLALTDGDHQKTAELLKISRNYIDKLLSSTESEPPGDSEE
ncbi:sigma 54-interacting transcriptional regulator [bacterium]|nr:sigma 54-interacting transcriptional regulator [candidate division CSSED10-310 bacterium]